MNEEVQFRRPELMPLSILRAIWKRKFLIAAVTVVLAVSAIAAVMMLPAVYSAETIILIEEQRIPERFVTPTVNEGLDARLNRISQQILAYDDLARLIEEFDLYPEDRGRLPEEEIVRKMYNDIEVATVSGLTANRGNTTAFKIAFEGSRPENVAQVANRLAGNFINENARTRTRAAVGTSEFITAQIKEAEQRLSEAEITLRDYRARYMGELPEQEGAVGAEISRRQVEYQGAEAEVARAHQEKVMLENSLEAAISSLEIVNRVATEDTVSVGGVVASVPSQRRARLAAATADYDALRSRYSETHPDVIRAKDYVEELTAALDEEEEEQEPVEAADGEEESASAEMPPREAYAILQAETRVKQIRTQIQVVEERIAAAEARRDQASAALAAAGAKMGRIPLHEQELAGAQRQYETALQNWQELTSKSFDADLATTMEQRERSERFTILQSARAPTNPVWPPRGAFAASGALGALVLACVLGFLLELKKNVVLGEWEMPPGVAVLGRIPTIVSDGDGFEAAGIESDASPRRRVLIVASSVVLSLAAMGVVTSLYFGWISF